MFGIGMTGYVAAGATIVIGLLFWQVDSLKDDISDRDVKIGAANERIKGLNQAIDDAAALNAGLILDIDKMKKEADRNDKIVTELGTKLSAVSADRNQWRRKYEVSNRNPEDRAYYAIPMPPGPRCVLRAAAGAGCEGPDEGSN